MAEILLREQAEQDISQFEQSKDGAGDQSPVTTDSTLPNAMAFARLTNDFIETLKNLAQMVEADAGAIKKYIAGIKTADK